MTLQQATVYTFCWCADLPQNVSAHEAHIVVSHISVDWSNYYCVECKKANDKSVSEIGGFDSNGLLIIVEIDDSFFSPKIPLW